MICSGYNYCDSMSDVDGVLCCKDPPVSGH
jgi:hypothetical protein